MFLARTSSVHPGRSAALLLVAAAFAAGLAAGALIVPASVRPSEALAAPQTREPAASALRSGHPAEVLRVIDAPELHARCDNERVKAMAARDALTRLLAEGSIGISRVGQDKYGGRVDADVSTARAGCLLGGVVRRRLRAPLFRRPARKLVRLNAPRVSVPRRPACRH